MERIRKRLEDMGMLKFLSVHYVCTQTLLPSKLLSLWREAPQEEDCRGRVRRGAGRGEAVRGEDIPPEEEGYFEIGETQLRISLEDIYFLIGLPTTGLRVEPYLVLP